MEPFIITGLDPNTYKVYGTVYKLDTYEDKWVKVGQATSGTTDRKARRSPRGSGVSRL